MKLRGGVGEILSAAAALCSGFRLLIQNIIIHTRFINIYVCISNVVTDVTDSKYLSSYTQVHMHT